MSRSLELVWNFAKELTKYAEGGFKNVTPAEYKKRMDACLSCRELALGSERCKLCGCHMPTKAKWKTTRCAMDKPKWEAVDGS